MQAGNDLTAGSPGDNRKGLPCLLQGSSKRLPTSDTASDIQRTRKRSCIFIADFSWFATLDEPRQGFALAGKSQMAEVMDSVELAGDTQ